MVSTSSSASAAQRGLSRPTKHPYPYTNVSVLCLSWENAPKEQIDGIQALVNIFRKEYNYDAETAILPTKPGSGAYTVEDMIVPQVQGWMQENGNHGSMMIIYYAGESRAGTDIAKCPVWHSTKDSEAVEIMSRLITRKAMYSQADVLFIHDSPYAQPDSIPFPRGIDIGTFSNGGALVAQVLTSGGAENFTPALIAELKAAADQGGVSVADIASRVAARVGSGASNGANPSSGIRAYKIGSLPAVTRGIVLAPKPKCYFKFPSSASGQA